jgi:hypothetical protein
VNYCIKLLYTNNKPRWPPQHKLAGSGSRSLTYTCQCFLKHDRLVNNTIPRRMNISGSLSGHNPTSRLYAPAIEPTT